MIFGLPSKQVHFFTNFQFFFQEKTEDFIAVDFNRTAFLNFNKRNSHDQIEPTSSSDLLNPSQSIFVSCGSHFLQECSENMPNEILDGECTGILMFENKPSTCQCSSQGPISRKLNTPVRKGWSKYTR